MGTYQIPIESEMNSSLVFHVLHVSLEGSHAIDGVAEI